MHKSALRLFKSHCRSKGNQADFYFGEAKIVESRLFARSARICQPKANKHLLGILTIPMKDEPYDENGIVRSIVDLEIGQNDLSELKAQGVELGELENDKYAGMVFKIVAPLYAQKFRAKIKLKGRVTRIIRQNQYLPLNINLMNQVETNLLMHYLETCEVKTKDLAALILTHDIMLLESSPFERAKSIFLVFDNVRNPAS